MLDLSFQGNLFHSAHYSMLFYKLKAFCQKLRLFGKNIQKPMKEGRK